MEYTFLEFPVRHTYIGTGGWTARVAQRTCGGVTPPEETKASWCGIRRQEWTLLELAVVCVPGATSRFLTLDVQEGSCKGLGRYYRVARRLVVERFVGRCR
jgi:hypothetical protein